MENTKENNAGEQQQFIPAGNGERSVEYTYKSSLNSPYFAQEECSKKDLEKLLTREEYDFIRKYTNFDQGRALNAAIRNGSLSEYGIKMKNSIISAIKKHSLKKEITVYRGIQVSNEIYIRNFYTKFILKEKIIGSLICSTSRSIKRAIKGTYPIKKGSVPIVFEMKLPKNYKALPVEDIAIRYQEKEILISNPIYTIKTIED